MDGSAVNVQAAAEGAGEDDTKPLAVLSIRLTDGEVDDLTEFAFRFSSAAATVYPSYVARAGARVLLRALREGRLTPEMEAELAAEQRAGGAKRGGKKGRAA